MQKYINDVKEPDGDVVAGASVTVRDANGELATLYSDNGVTTTPNPLTTDANGIFSFYAADGIYSLTVSKAGVVSQTISGVQLFDAVAGERTAATSNAYAVADVAITNNQFIDGRETRYSAAAGATNLFALSGYKPSLKGVYVSTGASASGPLFKINSGRYARMENVAALNAGAGGGILMQDTDATGVNRATLANVDIEDFSSIGLDMRSSVTELRASNMILAGIIDYVGGLGKPRAGSIGWKQNTPIVGGLAVGGHQVNTLNCITCDTGIQLTDAQLSRYTNVFADSCSGYGLEVLGASLGIDFDGLFVGTTRGIYVGGSSVVGINGLRTMYNGVVPPWGQASFYSGTAYDITVAGTAQVTVSGWRGDKKVNVAATARLIVMDGTTFRGRSIGTVGAGASGFFAEFGTTGTESDALWRAPAAGRLLRLCPAVDTAPGVGQTFTYTARKNGADTALVATITGTSFGGVDTWDTSGGIAVNKGDSIAIKLQTSAGAAVGRHTCELQFVPD
jgi:hypothetical protein